MVVVFLLGNSAWYCGFFKCSFLRWLRASSAGWRRRWPSLPSSCGKVPGHDVVLMLLVKGAHDVFQFFRQVEGANLGRVGQAVHHVGDAAVLQALGHVSQPYWISLEA